MEATNKANLAAMIDRMNALIAMSSNKQPQPSDKENTPPGGNINPNAGDGKRVKKPRKKKTICPNCKTFVLHKPELCYELEANKDSRYPGWKSIFTPAQTA